MFFVLTPFFFPPSFWGTFLPFKYIFGFQYIDLCEFQYILYVRFIFNRCNL